ncbi:MAG: hypothetical protein R3F59_33675 [Myxococcota bacterium]
MSFVGSRLPSPATGVAGFGRAMESRRSVVLFADAQTDPRTTARSTR